MERGLVGLGALAVLVLAAGLWRVAGGDETTPATDAGPVHVHGLGVNPADEALFIATHTGLYRSGEGDSKSVRVGDSRQDTMGFTVAGADRFLGSGHPDARQDLPSLLGLIESTDAGETWESISLLGEADFHVLGLPASACTATTSRTTGYWSARTRGERGTKPSDPLL